MIPITQRPRASAVLESGMALVLTGHHNMALQGNLEQLTAFIISLIKDTTNLQERVKVLDTNNGALVEQLKQSAAKVSAFQKEVDKGKTLETENRGLLQAQRSLHKKIEQLEHQNETAKRQLEAIKKQMQDLQNANQSLSQSATDSKKVLASGRMELHQSQTQVTALAEEKKALLHRVHLAESREASVKKDQERESLDLQKAQDNRISMKRELEELQELLRIKLSLEGQSKKHLDATEEAVVNLKAEVQNLNASLLASREENQFLSETAAGLRTQLKTLGARLDQFERVGFGGRPRPGGLIKATVATQT